MSETNKLEDVAIRAEKIRVSDLTGQINSAAEALKAQSAVEISIVNRISAEYVCADAQVVLRVVEIYCPMPSVLPMKGWKSGCAWKVPISSPKWPTTGTALRRRHYVKRPGHISGKGR